MQINSGNYPYQRLGIDPSKTSAAHVVFQPAPGASVSVDQIDFGQSQLSVIGPQHVTVKDLAVNFIRAWYGSIDVDWVNLRAKTFDIFDGNDVRILGGDFGPCETPAFKPCTSHLNGTNLLVTGAAIHDVTSTDPVNYHTDGLFIRGCVNCTVQNTIFYNNETTNIRIQDCCGVQPTSGLVLQNNFFGAPFQGFGGPARYDAVNIDTCVPGSKVLFNSFADGTGFDGCGTSASPMQIIGNLMGRANCGPDADYRYNWRIPFSPNTPYTKLCDATETNVTSYGYAAKPSGRGRPDLHATTSTPGNNGVPAAAVGGCPSDIDGQARPGAFCDAGADQN